MVGSGLQLGLTPREAWTFVALVVTLVAFGIVPRPLVDSRDSASRRFTGYAQGFLVPAGTR